MGIGKATGTINLKDYANLRSATQNFWFESNEGAIGAGAHVTFGSEKDFRDAAADWTAPLPDYNPLAGGTNLLMGADGLRIREGKVTRMLLDNDSLDFNIVDVDDDYSPKTVASFGQETTIGRVASGKYNVLINDSSGISLRRNTDTTFNVNSETISASIPNRGKVFETGYVAGKVRQLQNMTFQASDFTTAGSIKRATKTLSGVFPTHTQYNAILNVYVAGYTSTHIDFKASTETTSKEEIQPIGSGGGTWINVRTPEGTRIPDGDIEAYFTVNTPDPDPTKDYFNTLELRLDYDCTAMVDHIDVVIGYDVPSNNSDQVYLTLGTRSETYGKGLYSASFGENIAAHGKYSFASGIDSNALGEASHAEGQYTEATADGAHSEGCSTSASNIFSHAEGYRTIASGPESHAEGYNSEASKAAAHAEGWMTTASGAYSHSEGYKTTASGNYTHAEGKDTTAQNGHAEGESSVANGDGAHAEGYSTQASNIGAHSEGYMTVASGTGAHAEGSSTSAGANSHAEGVGTEASGGGGAHAGGTDSEATALAAFAHGYGVKTDKENGFVIGSYNKLDPGMTGATDVANYLFIIGNGTGNSTAARSNALTVDWDGNLALKNHDSPVGTIVENGNPSSYTATLAATSGGSGTWEFPVASSGNTIMLTPGVWSIICYARLTGLTASRQYGVCVGTATTNTTSSFSYRSTTRNIVHSTTTSGINLQATMILEVTENTYVRTGIWHSAAVTIGNNVANDIYTKAVRIV